MLAAECEGVVVPAPGLLGVPVDHAGHLLVQDAVVDVGLLRVQVFVEGCADHAVSVYGYAELFCRLANVRVVSQWLHAYFLSPPSCEKMRRLPPFSTNFLRSSISVGEKGSLGPATTKRPAFLTFSYSTASLLSPI